jgi:hypothetical protein
MVFPVLAAPLFSSIGATTVAGVGTTALTAGAAAYTTAALPAFGIAAGGAGAGAGAAMGAGGTLGLFAQVRNSFGTLSNISNLLGSVGTFFSAVQAAREGNVWGGLEQASGAFGGISDSMTAFLSAKERHELLRREQQQAASSEQMPGSNFSLSA